LDRAHRKKKSGADELSQFGWKLPQIASIPNGVDDVQDFTGKQPSADVKTLIAEQPYALFLGRISWKKGPDRLLRAFARTSTGNLIIAGPDDESLLPQLVRLSRELEIADRVRFLPRTVVGCDKEHLYAGAQVFVLPSYSENFGNTVLEAMRRGKPAIVTPEVGAAEVVQEAGGGLVVDGHPEPLGSAIGRLMADGGLARAMGAAGQRHVSDRYSWPRIAMRMEAFYETLRIRAEPFRR
jgi:glycosyltransferase involved in cell wall biosynthesis